MGRRKNGTPTECCDNCRFSQLVGSARLECHRYAPEPKLIPQAAAAPRVVWPVVQALWRCGEFEAKKGRQESQEYVRGERKQGKVQRDTSTEV